MGGRSHRTAGQSGGGERAAGRGWKELDVEAAPQGSDQLRLAFENAPTGIAVVTLEGRFARVNPALCRITGYTARELLATSFQEITHPDDVDKDVELAKELEMGDISQYQMEKRYLRPDGSQLWADLSVSIARNENGEPLYFIAHVEDIDDRVAARKALQHHALHDSLTGLANRHYLTGRFPQALEVAHRRQHEVAVLYCDLDGFKPINDIYGHDVGDAVLVEVARRVTEVLRASDTACRLGGDEFVVLCEDLAERVEAFGIADRLREAMATPIGHGARPLLVGMSIGVAFAGSLDEDLVDLLRSADRAMYEEKRRATVGVERDVRGYVTADD